MSCLTAFVVLALAFLMFGIVIYFIQSAWPLIGVVVIIWAIHKVWIYYKEKE
jgi:hypothetical protein